MFKKLSRYTNIVLFKKKWSSRIESANVWDKNLGVWDGVNDKLDMAEENTSEFECIVLKSVQNEKHREKKKRYLKIQEHHWTVGLQGE